MSFRLRVLLLVVLVAVTSAAATAWLTLREASHQFTESAAVDQAQVDMVTEQLVAYGQQHGTWAGVADLVQELRGRTGQRIHVVTESGTVLVDTDTLDGRAARPLGSATAIVDPRPTLSLPSFSREAAEMTVKAIVSYRREARYAACLSRNGVPVVTTTGSDGLPQFSAPTDALGVPEVERECRVSSADLDGPGVDAQVTRCVLPDLLDMPDVRPTAPAADGESDPLRCLAETFTEGISDVAPVPVRVYLGVGGEPTFTLAPRPLLAAVAGVVTIIVFGTLLLSHRVLRPIRTLTGAARRLGRGDLSSRVRPQGNDELAELTRTFNRMADSLQRGEERQRRLVADVAHELRTPLANLRGYLEALADGVISPDPDVFASLHEEAVLQQRIVDDLQDLALAEAGRLAYHRIHVDLAELLETCRTAHQARAASAGVSLTVHAAGAGTGGAGAGTGGTGDGADGGGAGAGDGDGGAGAGVPLLVYADPDRLRQVVGNLIGNALRATSSGGSVSLHAGRSGPDAVIRVVDTGTGIEPGALPYVFDRFWRGDPARGRRSGGSGLGLAIARQIVTDHGGTITVTSRVGEGTTFTITLPAIERVPARASASAPSPISGRYGVPSAKC
jgi:two-component system sensor histidine kinase BaeS